MVKRSMVNKAQKKVVQNNAPVIARQTKRAIQNNQVRQMKEIDPEKVTDHGVFTAESPQYIFEAVKAQLNTAKINFKESDDTYRLEFDVIQRNIDEEVNTVVERCKMKVAIKSNAENQSINFVEFKSLIANKAL